MNVILTDKIRKLLIEVCRDNIHISTLPEITVCVGGGGDDDDDDDDDWRSVETAGYADKLVEYYNGHPVIKYKLTKQGAIVGYRELAKYLLNELSKEDKEEKEG